MPGIISPALVKTHIKIHSFEVITAGNHKDSQQHGSLAVLSYAGCRITIGQQALTIRIITNFGQPNAFVSQSRIGISEGNCGFKALKFVIVAA